MPNLNTSCIIPILATKKWPPFFKHSYKWPSFEYQHSPIKSETHEKLAGDDINGPNDMVFTQSLVIMLQLICKKPKNKVDVQNNILHTPREASYVEKKNNFMNLSFLAPPPPFGPFWALIFQKKCLVAKLVLTKPSGLIWYVTTIYYVESHFFTILAIGGRGGN